MGRIGDFFRKVGRGIKKAAGWASEHIVRPAVKIINHPLIQTGLSKLGPIGAGIAAVGGAAGTAYGIYDKLKNRGRAPPHAPAPAPAPRPARMADRERARNLG
jgi:hypothetical protein